MMRIPRRVSNVSYIEDWDKVIRFVGCILATGHQPNNTEDIYSIVYKLSTNGYSNRCYEDLKSFVGGHLSTLHNQLLKQNEFEFLEVLTTGMENYQEALVSISVTFNYLDRQFVQKQLNTNLVSELEKDFCNRIIKSNGVLARLEYLIPKVRFLENKIMNPPTFQKLITGLYKFCPQTYLYNPQLFLLYIPAIFHERGLDEEKENINLERSKLLNQSLAPGQFNKKRKYCQIANNL